MVSIPLADALALFEGHVGEVVGHECGRGRSTPSPVPITVAEFAAGESGGYPARALSSLLEVVSGGTPVPFELRRASD